MICPSCGKTVPDYSIYCWSCGRPLTEAEKAAGDEHIFAPAGAPVDGDRPPEPFAQLRPDAAALPGTDDLDEDDLDEDDLDEDDLDEDDLDEDDLDEDDLDEDALDEDALDEDALDEDDLDEDALDEDALDEDDLGEDITEDITLDEELAGTDGAADEEDWYTAQTISLDAATAKALVDAGSIARSGPDQEAAGKASAAKVTASPAAGGGKKGRRALIGTVLALALLALCWFLLLTPSARYDRNIHRAEACMAENDYQGALEHYAKAAALRPTAEALQGQAAAYLNLGDMDRAAESYRQLLKLEPEQEGAWAALADIYLAQGDHRAALNALDQGIETTGSPLLRQQLEALLSQLGITNYTAEEVAAADNIWPIGAAEGQALAEGQAPATDLDVVAVLENGVLKISRNGLDSDGRMADLARFADPDSEAESSFRPWLELGEAGPAVTRLEIGGGVVNIGAGAFSECAAVTSVSLSAEVEEIGESAFAGCTALSLVELAEDSRLTKVGPYAFRGCAGLHELKLPDTVESLGSGCFYASGLLELTLPASLTLLSQGALNNCPVLTTVNVNTAMTDLGLVPFYRCPQLQSINVAADNRNYSSYDGLLYDKSGAALLRCPEGRELCSFGPELTAIGERAFYACAKLTGVDLPQGLTAIDREAFAFCSKLSYVYLPASLASIGSRAFVYCPALSGFTLDQANKSFRVSGDLLLSADGATLLCCPIASAAGSGGVLRLPRSVQTVAEGACTGCGITGLICYNVAAIGASAFADCSSLSSAVLPESVASIGAGAFSGSADLAIYCKAGSYAEEYAKAAGYQVHNLSDFVLSIFN